MAGEADWENIALECLAEHGWVPQPCQAVAPGTDGGRTSWDDLVLRGPLLAAMRKLNPLVPAIYLEQALDEIVRPDTQAAIDENYRMHRILVHGYRGVSYIDSDGIEQNPTIRLVSHRVEDNEWRAVNQVTVRSKEAQRRFDIVLYLNGMPVAMIELKNGGTKHATIAKAHAQLATYLHEFPMAFRFNRTFRGKPDGLLVAYAPLVENLEKALAQYTADDQTIKPVGRDVVEAAVETRRLIEQLDALCAGFGWRAKLGGGRDPAVWLKTATGLANWLRSPSTPGNQVKGDSVEGPEPVGQRFRKLVAQLARWWSVASGRETLADLWPAVQFYEQVRVFMASSMPSNGRLAASRCPKRSSGCCRISSPPLRRPGGSWTSTRRLACRSRR